MKLLPTSIQLILASLAFVLGAAGCENGKNVKVRGHVTVDGQPAEQGTISFEPSDGNGPTSGGPIVNGDYELSGKSAVPPGAKLIRIKAFRKTGKKIRPSPGSADFVDEIVQCIPKEYNDESALKAEVENSKEKVQTLNFDLTTRR